MSIQTEAMREGADRYITATETDDGWHGVEIIKTDEKLTTIAECIENELTTYA